LIAGAVAVRALIFFRGAPPSASVLRSEAVGRVPRGRGSLWETLFGSSRADRDAAFVKTLDSWDAHVLNATAAEIRALVPEGTVSSKRTLVVYAYAHAEWRLLNLDFFLRYGLVDQTSDGAEVDYTFVFNGVDAPVDIFKKRGIPHRVVHLHVAGGGAADANAAAEDSAKPRVLVIVRENSGFDMCASRLVLEHGLAARPGTYTHVVLMNGSVRGPFQPSYVSFSWIDAFQQFLVNGVKLVGTTINCMSTRRGASAAFSSLHVQSMVLALDAAGARALFPMLQCYDTMNEAISHGEIGITQAVLAAGYGVAALQRTWHDFPIFSHHVASPEVERRCAFVSETGGGDPSYPGAYLGGEPHALELVFIKTNRDLDTSWLEREEFVRRELDRSARSKGDDEKSR
jgi:hypothetical protein